MRDRGDGRTLHTANNTSCTECAARDDCNRCSFDSSALVLSPSCWASCCAYCSESADTLDHVVPRLRGGLTVAHNLVPACRRCNGAKGSTDWRQWFADQEWYCIEREARIDGWIS
jgi:5-methylcytosine-specific restriction endonuclease McrA